MKHFNLVKEYLQAQLELTAGDKDAQALFRRNEDRFREQQHGQYDIRTIEKCITSQPRVDATDYIVNTVVGVVVQVVVVVYLLPRIWSSETS